MPKNRTNEDGKFTGCIADIRAIEDCIRQTRRYAEGIQLKQAKHPEKIQGGEFPSVTFTKPYTVYPDYEISWDMPVGTALNWMLNPLIAKIEVEFFYSYRDNTASVFVEPDAVRRLEAVIPGLRIAIDKVRCAVDTKSSEPRIVCVDDSRLRALQRAKQLAH